MTLCDAVRDFGPKVTLNYRETRYCSFAAPEETVGVIDASPAGGGSHGIAFLADRMIVKLSEKPQQIYYNDIRVMEILPSYETPFEDELLISSPSGDIRISDCSLNKFFLRQLVSNICRISATMSESDREALAGQLTSDALNYYAQSINASPQRNTSEVTDPEQPVYPSAPVKSVQPLPEAAAAVPVIAAAKKAALAEIQPKNAIGIPEEKIQWISGKQPKPIDKTPHNIPPLAEDISDMTHEQTMNYLLDSIAEINSEQDQPAEPERHSPPQTAESPQTVPVQADKAAEVQPPEPENPPQPPVSPFTKEPDSPDIYIQASRRIREMCEDGRLDMQQVYAAVREQLVPASELYAGLDIENAQLPPAVKKRALQLTAAADRLPEYFALGEDIAARVMFFMLYQMLSYTDRIVQSDDTKQRLNYFFVRFGAAGMALSMLDANN